MGVVSEVGPRAWLLPEESWDTSYYTRGVERQWAENVQAGHLSTHSSPTHGSPRPPQALWPAV